MKMRKGRLLTTALLLGMLLCAGCGSEAVKDVEKQEESAEEMSEELSSEMEGNIDVAEDLPDREIKVPDYLKESAAPIEDTEESSQHLSGEEQAEEARQIADHIKESIDQVLTDKDYYPNITGITVSTPI